MLFKGLIFDLDGTLLDSLEDLANAGNSVLKGNGLKTHPIKSYQYFVGNGLQKLIERIAPQYQNNHHKIVELMAEFKQIYSNSWKEKSRLYAGIPELIRVLKERGAQLAVFSNKPHDFTQLIIDEFFEKSMFSIVRGQKERVAKKPDPTGVFLICESLGLAVDDVAFVGDSATDIQTAKNAGMKSIGVEWGFRDRQELQENGADWIVGQPKDIAQIVLV